MLEPPFAQESIAENAVVFAGKAIRELHKTSPLT
jgi:hypothetical protein